MKMQREQVELFAETVRLAFVDQGKGDQGKGDQGEGHAFLLLHGGAGPGSMLGLAGALATNARVIVPTHPGFDGEPRLDRFARIEDLVLAYLALIERLKLTKVTLVGNSMGGWIAAEMALRESPRVAGIVLLNAVGIDGKVADLTAVPPPERAALAFHDPQKFAIAPSGPEAAAAMAQNQRTLRVYAGELMHDPTLRARLAETKARALVAWGESDRIVGVDYGRLFARSIPGARFELVPNAGHFPHIERLADVVRLIGDFTAQVRS